VGSFPILPIGTYAASSNFHQPRDTTQPVEAFLSEGLKDDSILVPLPIHSKPS
jgi:hypothetical protein